MAVAVGAACDFLTPIGHQCNTLVMGPGGYRFGDYWRLGLPLLDHRAAGRRAADRAGLAAGAVNQAARFGGGGASAASSASAAARPPTPWRFPAAAAGDRSVFQAGRRRRRPALRSVAAAALVRPRCGDAEPPAARRNPR